MCSSIPENERRSSTRARETPTVFSAPSYKKYKNKKPYLSQSLYSIKRREIKEEINIKKKEMKKEIKEEKRKQKVIEKQLQKMNYKQGSSNMLGPTPFVLQGRPKMNRESKF